MTQEHPKPAKRAVLYLRTRTINGSDQMVDAELARQRAICQQVARRHGVQVVHEYVAIGRTRANHVRQIVAIMLDAVARDRVDYIITTGIDRLCRGPVQADRELISAIRRSGARLLCGNAWGIPGSRQLVGDVIVAHASGLYRAATGRSA